MDYKQKYLKYKNKYLDLYKLNIQTGGCITNRCRLEKAGLLTLSGDDKTGQRKNAIDLEKAGFDIQKSIDIARELNDSQIQNIFKLKKADFSLEYAYEGAKKLNDSQITNAIALHDFSTTRIPEKASIEFSKGLKGDPLNGQIKLLIDLTEISQSTIVARSSKYNYRTLYNIITELSGDIDKGQIRAVVDLIIAGVQLNTAYNIAKQLTNYVNDDKL
jgi:hypothetical protein